MIPTPIGTTSFGAHWLDAPAAASWFRMVRDGCPAAGITDAGRTQQEQIDVFLKYFTTNYATSARVDQRYWNGQNYWRRPGQPSAATPGSVQARHTFGRALDLNGATKAWVRAHGHHYGWIKDLVRGEDWHMEYQPQDDVEFASNPGGSTGNVPNVPGIDPIDPIQEDDMSAADVAELKRYIDERLGTGGITPDSPLPDADTLLGVGKTIRASTNGVPEAFTAIRNAIPTASAIAAAVWATPVNRTVDGKVRQIPALQELADTKSGVLVLLARDVNGDVDEAALATALAPLLTVGLTEAQVVAAVRSVFADAGKAR